MNKGRKRVNLEVRPRSYSGSYTYKNSNEPKDELSRVEKLMIKSIISGIIILGVFLLNRMDTNFSKGITEQISKAISYQVQWNELFKNDVISNFEDKIASILHTDKEVFSTTEDLNYLEPVQGHLTSEFEEKTHPVFNTKIEPRGVEYSIFENQDVAVSSDGIVLSILTSTYQGKRIVVQHNDQFKTVYDGVENCQVEEGQEVKKGESLGTIEANEEKSKLFFFEVWKDNVAVDPQTVFGTVE
ncbi:MAG: peptidoglycan DD-metalloendopeptidase family protein [Eubacteriales bacterium]